MSDSVAQARRGGEAVVESRGFEWSSRVGFVARGLIYGIIGILAVKLAIGVGGKTTNQKRALETDAHPPGGNRQRDRARGRRRERDRLRRHLRRCDRDHHRSGTGSIGNAKKTAGGVLGWPADQWLVGIAGVVLSVFDLLARMVVFGLVGIFLIKAAVDYSAKQAVGLDGALPKLAAQSDGPPCPASSLPGSCRLPCSRSATRATERPDRRRLRSARGGHEVTDELRLLDANEARFVRDRDGLRPRVDVELREDPLHVARHRLG
jgi:hypothetical protein